MKKLLILLALVLTLSSIFAMGAKEDDAVHITLWHSSQGSALTVFEEIIEDFNATVGKENNIVVDAVYQGKANDVLTKVNAAALTSTLPDIAMMDATAALDMNGLESLVTLEEIGVDTSLLLEPAKNNFTSLRGTIALPFNASALLYYYNKTAFDEKGVDVPKTIDDMTAIASILSERDKNGNLTVSFFEGVPATYELSYFISAQNGGTYMVNKKNGHEGTPDEVLFETEGTYKSFLEKWKALFDTASCSTVTSSVSDDFIAGATLSMLSSSSNLTYILNAVDSSFEVGVAPVPVVNESATGGAIVSGGALFSFTNSKAVKLVLEYLISPEVQAAWSEATGYIPVNKETYSNKDYLEFLAENPIYITAPDYVLSSSCGMVNVWLPSAYTIYYSFQKNVSDVINGKDIDKAVSEMASEVKSALDSYKAQN